MEKDECLFLEKKLPIIWKEARKPAYFAWHPDDYDDFLESKICDLLKTIPDIHKYTLFYLNPNAQDPRTDEAILEKYQNSLKQMKKIVFLVTERFLSEPSVARDHDLCFSIQHRLSFVQIMEGYDIFGLWDGYENLCEKICSGIVRPVEEREAVYDEALSDLDPPGDDLELASDEMSSDGDFSFLTKAMEILGADKKMIKKSKKDKTHPTEELPSGVCNSIHDHHQGDEYDENGIKKFRLDKFTNKALSELSIDELIAVYQDNLSEGDRAFKIGYPSVAQALYQSGVICEMTIHERRKNIYDQWFLVAALEKRVAVEMLWDDCYPVLSTYDSIEEICTEILEKVDCENAMVALAESLFNKAKLMAELPSDGREAKRLHKESKKTWKQIYKKYRRPEYKEKYLFVKKFNLEIRGECLLRFSGGRRR